MHVLTGDKIQIQPSFKEDVYLRPYPCLSILSGIKSPRILFLSLDRFRLLSPTSHPPSSSLLCLSLAVRLSTIPCPSFILPRSRDSSHAPVFVDRKWNWCCTMSSEIQETCKKREKERERESVCVCVCVCVRERERDKQQHARVRIPTCVCSRRPCRVPYAILTGFRIKNIIKSRAACCQRADRRKNNVAESREIRFPSFCRYITLFETHVGRRRDYTL